MEKRQAEVVAKIIRHEAVEIINSAVSKSNIDWFIDSHARTKFNKLIADISRDIMNINTMQTLSETNSSDKSLIQGMLTKHTVLQRMEEKGMSMANLQIGSWTCEAPDGVGTCIINDFEDCIFCGEPDERK